VNAVRSSDSALSFIVQVLFANPSLERRFSKCGAYAVPLSPRFPSAHHCKRSVLRTYNFGLIRMIAFRLCVSAGGHFSPACAGVLKHTPLLNLIEFKAINRPEVCAPVYTTSRPDMFVDKSLSVALAILWSIVCAFCSDDPCPCTKPTVRREWRAFRTEEKAEWIRAIKVCIDTLIGRLAKAILGIQCLSKEPHDSALTPSVDPSLSLIPPVNTSSSYFDGMIQSFSLAFPGVRSSNYVFTQT
jgi:hypothetical protein